MKVLIVNFGLEFLNILGEMAPYLILGFFIAGLLHGLIPTQTIQKYFGGNKIKSSVNAALFGVPIPLCSCGVIPTGMSLYKNGASKGSTVSFLISTPQTGVDSMLVTYSMLGLPFAIIRPVIAFITGVFGGVLTNTIDKSDNQPIIITSKNSKANATVIEKVVDIFNYGFVEFLQDISKWLIIGLVLAAAISATIPNDFITGLHINPLLQMFIVLLISVPLYICATASVPLAAVLMLKGLSPGAALVLLMAGPATNAATITMIGNVMGKKTLFGYLLSIVSGALIFGLLIDYVLPTSWFQIMNTSHLGHNHQDMMPNWMKISSGCILIILIINGYFQKYRSAMKIKNTPILSNDMGTKTVKVEGMTCNHCKANVENNLSKLSFINDVKVDLATGIVVLEGDDINLEKVKEVVNGLGYKYQSN